MMKRLLFMLAFLVSFGFAAVGQTDDPNEEESSNNTEQNETTPQGPLERTVDLPTDGASLAEALGDDVAKVTKLIVSGTLTVADFATMKDDMRMLQILDMSEVTTLPILNGYNDGQEINGMSIPQEALHNKQTLLQVVLPSCLQVIGWEAFFGCNNLNSIEFTNFTQPQLKIICSNAFSDCSGLQTLDLSMCKELQYINNNAFFACNNLLSVNLSGCTNLLSIGGSSFYGCSSLQTVTLSNCEQLIMIGGSAFSNCSSLSTVNMDGCNNFSEIGYDAFYNCSQLYKFDFKQLPNLQTIRHYAFYSTILSGTICFPKKIYQIELGAFVDCDSIKEITFDKGCSLAVIAPKTFGLCDSLQTIDFSNCASLNTLDKEAFYSCKSLKQITIDNGFYKSVDGVLYVVDMATLMLYPSAKEDEAFTIPSTVQTIQANSFPFNQYLKTITIPSSVKSIQPNAFSGGAPKRIIMESATPIGLSSSIGLGNSIVIVPEEGLEAYKSAAVWKDYKIVKAGTSDLVEINLDGSQSLAVVLANEGIDLDLISQLKITGSIKASDFGTLRQMNNLTQLDLGEATLENNEIPSGAFQKDNSLLEVIILPVSTKTIGSYAFECCKKLRDINLSDLANLEIIGQAVFWRCTSLTNTLVFPQSLQTIESDAFAHTNLISIDVSQTQLTHIDENAFLDCVLSGDIVFPKTLTNIGYKSFNLAEFSSITLKAQDTYLNGENFLNTNKSTCELHVPYGSLTYYQNANYWRDFSNIIEEEAIPGESLEITLEQMGSLENYLTINEINVENVTELTISGPMDWRDIKQICTMTRLQKLNMLNVQMENNYLPESAFVIWSMDYEGPALRFLKEVVLPKDLQSIGSNAFWAYKRLSKVVLPTTLKRLDGFPYCSMLSDINIGDCTSLEYIGGFDGCTSLPSTLVLPNSVKRIGSFGGSSITYIDLSQTSIESLWGTFAGCALTGDWDFPGTLSKISGEAFNSAQFTSIKLRNLEMVQLSGKNAFPAVDLNTFKIYVPHDLVETYQKDTYWYDYRNNIVGFGNTVSAISNNEYCGTVSGSGVYESGDKVTLNAICKIPDWNTGWRYVDLFVGWFEGENIISTDASYQFTADGQEHTYIGKFERIEFNNYEVYLINNDLHSVTVSIDLTNLDNETFFTGWYEDDVCISKNQTITIQVKDGSKERWIRPRFEGKTVTYSNTTITDANKVDGQDVTLYSGVTVSGSTTWKPSSVALRRGASVLIDSPIETSTITLEDWDLQYGWRYIALPYDLLVSEIVPYGESSNIQFVVRYYDGAARAQNGIGSSWKQLKNTDKLEANKGYIIQSNTWGGFKYNTSTGMDQLLNYSSVTVPLQKYTSVTEADKNWNFIGNPFPCYYKIGTLYENGFKGTITVWDEQLDNYQYYTQDDADQYLKPLTAFFVQQTDEVSSILFTTSGRAAKLPEGTTRSASALRSSDGRQVLNLTLSNDSLSDKTRIVFNEAAQAGYELGRDAAKLRSMNPNAPAFYSIDVDNQQLAINERPWGDGVVRLGCNFGVKGEYTIALQESVEQDLILVDLLTGAQTNLKEQTYRFTAEVGETNDRFELRSGNPTGTETIVGLQWQVRGGQLFLTGLPADARVVVHDTMGRTVCDRTASGDLSGLALPQAGVYYLTVSTRQASKTERIMVKE